MSLLTTQIYRQTSYLASNNQSQGWMHVMAIGGHGQGQMNIVLKAPAEISRCRSYHLCVLCTSDINTARLLQCLSFTF